MGFVQLTCTVCGGSKIEEIYGGHGTVIEQTCSNCNGDGYITVHAGNIGSSIVSPPIPDECWQDLIDHGSTTYTIKQGEDGQVHTEKVDILYKKDDPKSKV